LCQWCPLTQDTQVAPSEVQVLFIAGTGRSGSTILANILGQIEGCISVGEMRYFWARGLVGDWYCGCGERFSTCGMWQKVVAEAFEGPDRADPADTARRLWRATRVRTLPRMAMTAFGRSPEMTDDLAARIRRLYQTVASVSGCGTVIDSSKLPTYGRLIERTGLDVRVLHLVRDPRAAAYSWLRRRKPRADATPTDTMEVMSGAKSALLWDLWNGMATVFWGRSDRYLRVRYEDFAREPQATVAAIARFAGLDGNVLPFVAHDAVDLQRSHTVSGNPNRLASGRIAISADDEWSERMPIGERMLVTLGTLPLLVRFGYPVVPARPSSRPLAGARPTVQELPAARRFLHRIRRHWQWARADGVRRLLEEDDLRPVVRARRAAARRRWLATNAGGPAMPVFIVGVQRSGTNMVVAGLAACPAVDVCNENDRRAFERFELRDDATIRRLVDTSVFGWLVMKPLCDSHRVDHLLDDLGTARPGRALWVYRGVDDRVRSAVAKFGSANLDVLQDFAAGRGTNRWQVQRLSPASLELLAALELGSLSPESGAALLWYVRNSLYFELGLCDRADVSLVSYEHLLVDPEGSMRRLCDFLDLPFSPGLLAHIRGGPHAAKAPLPLDPLIRDHCDELAERLNLSAALPLAKR
jgi:Sulfotransferase family